MDETSMHTVKWKKAIWTEAWHMIPIKWHSGKDKTVKILEILVAAKVKQLNDRTLETFYMVLQW